jgi:hypothetical protein
MAELLTIGQLAHELDARPQDISNLFYRGKIRPDCSIVSGRRLVPRSRIREVKQALEKSKARAEATGA